MQLNEFIQYFNGVKLIGDNQYMAECPCHDDKEASLAITEKDNKILLHCFAGCERKDILKATNLLEKDLFNNEQQELPRIVKQYIYTDEKGKPLHRVMRFEPKNFMQSKYENGKWINKMEGTHYVPYNLPNVKKADVVYWVEGGKGCR